MTRSADLAEQLDFYWTMHLWPRLAGLSEDEYRWRPVGDVWSISPDAAGAWRPDGSEPAPPTPPVTSIAWRLNHLTREVLGTRARSLFGGSPLGAGEAADMYDARHWPEPVPADAAGALSLLERAYREWTTGVHGLDDEAMRRPLGPRGGPYADDSYAQLVLHINREVMAHGAEVCLLRDLYRGQADDRDPLVAAALRGDVEAVRAAGTDGVRPGLVAEAAGRRHWAVVRVLIEAGGSPEGALHYAAAAGDSELSELLIAHGARLDAVDTVYGQTPAGWARYCGHYELADRLDRLAP